MATPFRLYNSLSRTVEDFEPLEPGRVGVYVCGMTVYDDAHVGHACAMVVFDAFVRYLRYRGWDVTFIRNFTDVDDKIIRRAAVTGEEPTALAQRYIDHFHRDTAALGLVQPDEEPRVSECIDDITSMINTLVQRGHAYESEGSVWFSVTSDDNYGALSGRKVEDVNSADADFGKKHPADFALWKAAKQGEVSWSSPWGPGRPGWHIECSAMAKKHLGPTIDIHGGGLDLVFPHHENEISQSCCANEAPYARYWMHNGLLNIGNELAERFGLTAGAKMGKSLGNAFNIELALKHFPAEAIRLYYLRNHYRSPLPWNGYYNKETGEVSAPDLSDALATLARLYEAREVAEAMGGSEPTKDVVSSLGPDAQTVYDLGLKFSDSFHKAMDEDFNTAQAMAYALELARAINRFANHKKAKKRGAPVVAPALKGLQILTQSLGLMALSTEDFVHEVKEKRLAAMGISRQEVEQLIEDRDSARASKDWGRADDIRATLTERSIVVMDTPSGAKWRVAL